MKIEDIDLSRMEFTPEELKFMGEIVMKAEEIKKDTMVFALVEKEMKKKSRAIKDLTDLRREAQLKRVSEDPIKT